MSRREPPVIDASPGQPVPVGANLGQLYLDQGYLEEARDVFEAVLRTDPGNVGAREGLVAVDRQAAVMRDSPALRKVATLRRWLARLERG